MIWMPKARLHTQDDGTAAPKTFRELASVETTDARKPICPTC